MADETTLPQHPAPSTEANPSAPSETATAAAPAEKTDAATSESAPAAEVAREKAGSDEEKPKEDDKPQEQAATESASKPAKSDAEPKHETTTETEDSADKLAEPTSETQPEEANGADESVSQNDKSAKGRRKSSAGVSKANTLKKKASKAKILNLDAKPGDHFFAKLKGFPPWPVVICSEDMLPQNMLSSRPVTAARQDGTYRDDFADGGKRVNDRTFPVLYLHTNEFSWTPNTDLSDLDAENVESLITSKMRKDLQEAHKLAAENNDLDYYKDVLIKFEEAREEARQEKAQRAEAKAAAAAEKKAKAAKATKSAKKSKATVDDDGDMEMEDIDDEDAGKPKAKKRKAEDANETPQRSNSVKKPKIKLTSSSTPKATNGVSSPKDSATKTLKVKAKPKEKKAETPKEPELSPEEKKERKQKEILFLRHKLQKGLLNRTAPPQEEEMKSMSEYLGKLETFPDLEADIIKATKINKVLKAMLKLDAIPKEEEFKFKPRSQTLLEKWTKTLNAAESSTPVPTNGVNGEAKSEVSNGIKEKSVEVTDKNGSDAQTVKTTETSEEASKKGSADEKETTEDAKPEATAVESTA